MTCKRKKNGGDNKEKELVYKTMKELNKDVRPGDVAEAAGLDKRKVSKYIAELKKEGKVFSPKRCYYRAK